MAPTVRILPALRKLCQSIGSINEKNHRTAKETECASQWLLLRSSAAA
ncbi:hypothetical protein [Cupriavidus sp. TMH.W2]